MPNRPYFDDNGNFHVRPYRIKDLASIYGVCNRTVRKWMEANNLGIGKKTCKYFSIEQVATIVGALGVPYKLPVQE